MTLQKKQRRLSFFPECGKADPLFKTIAAFYQG